MNYCGYSGESIVKDISILENETLEGYILNTINQYIGKSVDELAEKFDINIEEKNHCPNANHAMLASRMLGIFGNLERTEEFFKANVQVKTIQVNKNGTIKENMSFPTFKFNELAAETWEESILRDMLDSAKFFFVVFEEQSEGSTIFKGAKFWSMPEYELDTTVKDAWQETVDTLNYGVELVYNGRVVKNNFINGSDKRIIHVRPHASKSSYLANNANADELPVPAHWTNKPSKYADNWMTKQCFWLNNDYVLEQVKELLNVGT